MGPIINKDLLPLKIHYFFKYGGIAFFILLPVVARQKGIPAVAVGLIWMVTPMSSCAINFINSALADKFKIYRGIFLGSIITLTVSYLSFFLLPNVVNQTSLAYGNTSSSRQCANFNTSSLALCSAVPPDLESWKCSEKDHTEEKDQHCVLHCHFQQNSDENEPNQTFVFHDMKLNFNTSVRDQYHVCEEGPCTIITTSSSSCGNLHKSATCHYYCDPEAVSLLSLTEKVQFWLMFVVLITIYGSNSTSTTMADTICFQLLGKDGRHLYGRQRLFGSIGWGIAGLAGGALVDAFSHGDNEQVNYFPVVIIASIFLGCNIVASIRIPFKVHDREKLKASRVGRALCTFPFLIYLLTVIVGGINMGIVWTFLFIVIEDIAGPSFVHMKLLQGLLMGVGCFLGEVPSLFLSAVVIKKLGSVRTFVISLSIMAVRVLLYSVVKNPWLFLPVDLLHGASFGLFYPNMIAYASQLSPPGAMATVQGTVKNTFIIGLSLGSLIGGLLVSAVGGPNAFFYLGIFDIIFTVVFALVQYLFYICHSTGRQVEYHAPAVIEVESDVVMEEQRSVCDLQMCTPCPDIPELEFSPPVDHDDTSK